MKIKRIIAAAFCLLLCALAAHGEADAASQLRAKHEATVVKALQMLTRFGSDDISLYSQPEYFIRKTAAWEVLENFDRGWFTKTSRREFKDIRTENWTPVSDTEFCVDAYCDYVIGYSYATFSETFHCGFHFCFRQTDARKDVWQIYDYHNLPLESEAEYAKAVTDANRGITVYPVTGKSFEGYMTIIADPSRVFVGTIDAFGSGREGLRINGLVKKYNAVGGINGGGFSDAGGTGNGGQPNGLIVSEGKQLRPHSPNGQGCNVVVGFDENNRLVVGKFKSVEGLNLRDAMAFNYMLVENGRDVTQNITKSGYTTRTAIGQDASGRVLMLVVKGRQPNSLGASIPDLAKVMLEYGAITAANLDGGTSTCLYLGGQNVYSGYRLDVSRKLPAAFLIKAQ